MTSNDNVLLFMQVWYFVYSFCLFIGSRVLVVVPCHDFLLHPNRGDAAGSAFVAARGWVEASLLQCFFFPKRSRRVPRCPPPWNRNLWDWGEGGRQINLIIFILASFFEQRRRPPFGDFVFRFRSLVHFFCIPFLNIFLVDFCFDYLWILEPSLLKMLVLQKWSQ